MRDRFRFADSHLGPAMTTRRMLIEDYELMAHARRAYLAWLDARAQRGEELGAEEARRRDVLREDTRLERALLMDWELRDEVDAAIIAALQFIDERALDDLAPQRIPAHELPFYLQHRKEAIQRVIARLRGEL